MKNVRLLVVAKLDQLLRAKTKGSAHEIAKLLAIPRTTFYDLIAYLRDAMRINIFFAKEQNRYEYEFIPKFYLGQGIYDNLVLEDSAGDGEIVLSEELEHIEGGVEEKDDWESGKFNDEDADNRRIDPDTNLIDCDY